MIRTHFHVLILLRDSARYLHGRMKVTFRGPSRSGRGRGRRREVNSSNLDGEVGSNSLRISRARRTGRHNPPLIAMSNRQGILKDGRINRIAGARISSPYKFEVSHIFSSWGLFTSCIKLYRCHISSSSSGRRVTCPRPSLSMYLLTNFIRD